METTNSAAVSEMDLKALQGSPLAMVALEGAEHVVRDVNAAFCRLVFKDRQVLLGRPFAEVNAEWGVENECIAMLDRVYRTHESETLVDEPQSQFAGVEPSYWSYAAWVTPASTGGDPVGVVVQVVDSTLDHNFRHMSALMNQELLVTSVRLHEQTEAMARADNAKDKFLAMLGHELRNPLNAINNAAKLVEMQTADQEEVQKPVKMLMRQVRHTARLVDDLLDISRITHGKLDLRKERVDLSVAARAAAEIVQPQMDLAGCTLNVSTPVVPIWMDGDAARLEQILCNLLNNAAKYTDRGGTVDLKLTRDGDDALIEVHDTGIGITPELIPHVFDLFVQEDRSLARSQGGLGIGLTLVKSLTELHGGRVGVKSAGLGLGSVFTVRLPVSRERGTGVSADASKTDVVHHNILLVDDNVSGAEALSDILQIWGHVVRIEHDGPSAIKAVREDAPDIVLLDLGLPKMDGFEVARALRAIEGSKHLRIVALTGYGSEEDRRMTRAAGFDDHLVKPVDVDGLKQYLVTYLG